MDLPKDLVKGEIIDDAESLTPYSIDASIFKIKPQMVICPKDAQDISNIVNYVNKHPNKKLSITARSAGTDMSGGAINDGILLDMTKHFDRIIEIGPDFSIVQPGVFYRDFEVETLKHNLILPCYTSSRDINTVGGMVANNSAGEKTLSYGQTERYVENLKAVLADGNEYLIEPLDRLALNKKMAQKNFEGDIYRKIYDLIDSNSDLIKHAKPRVSKNATGYMLWSVWDGQIFNLTKLLVGSQGTLGVITESKLKLVAPKHFSKLVVISLNNIDNLPAIINTVLDFNPESFETYDDQTLGIATKFLPEVIKSVHETLFSLGFQFIPEMIMKFTGSFPKLVLLAEFTGNSLDEVTQKCRTAQKALNIFKVKTNITGSDMEEKKYWTLRRQSFNMLRHHSAEKRTAPFIDDIIVKPERLPEFLPKLKIILDQYKDHIIYTIAGHIGNGNFHIIPLMDFKKDDTKTVIFELSQKVFELVKEYDGSMSGEHNDGLVRGPFLEEMYGESVYQLFKQVKNIFDPDNIFNPHKKTDATFEYSYSHFAKE